MPSRQERRKAERDAAKRAPAQAGAANAAGAAGAAAAAANERVNPRDPGGDWTSQAEDPAVLLAALDARVVKHMAGEGDMEAQWSLGYLLVYEANLLMGLPGLPLGAAGRTAKADVGFALVTLSFPVAHQTV